METSDFVVEKPVRSQLDQVIKIGTMGRNRLAWCGPVRSAQHHSSAISPKDGQMNSDHEETLDRPRLRNILQKKSLLLFRNVKSLKTGRLRNGSRLKKTKVTCTIHDGGLNAGPERRRIHCGGRWGNLNRIG